MYFYKIIGRSNIGDRINQYLIQDDRFIENNNPDIIFLVGTKENSSEFKQEEYPNSKIIDVSSYKRLNSLTNLRDDNGRSSVYAIPHITYQDDYKDITYFANPGCSAIGSITAIYPILDFVNTNIVLDTKFSKSALTRKSKFNEEKDIMTVVHPFEHTHQKEINYYFNNAYNIKMIPSIIDVSNGISINIHAFKNDNIKIEKDLIFNTLNNYYRWYRDTIMISNKEPFKLKYVINTNKIGIYVKEDEENVLINVVLDNLTVGGAYTAYKNALKIIGE